MVLPPQLHVSTVGLAELQPIVPPAKNRNPPFVKPQYGLWTSTYDPGKGSGWIQWCLGEYFAKPPFRCWLLTPKDAEILVIDHVDDLTVALNRYGISSPYRPHSRYLDFEELSKHYDAVHLTEKGQWETRLSHPDDLYGWDCESTLWFRWAFGSVEDLGMLSFEESVV